MSFRSKSIEDPLKTRGPDLGGLIQSAAARDRKAFEDLYDRSAPFILGLSLRILRSQSAAEEAVIDVFLEVWEKAPRFDPARHSPLPWLLAIARMRCLERLRSAGNVIPISDAVDSAAFPDGTDAGLEAWHLEEAANVRRALESVPSEQRVAIEIAFFEGRTSDEIAERLRVSPGTVRDRIRLGMSALSEEIRKNGIHRS